MSIKSPERQETVLVYETVDFSSLEGLSSLQQYTASFLQKWQKYSNEAPLYVYLPPGVSVNDMNYYYLAKSIGLGGRRTISGQNRSQAGRELWEESEIGLQLSEWKKPLAGVFVACLGAAQDLSSKDVSDLVLHARPKSYEAFRFAFVASEYSKMVQKSTAPVPAGWRRFFWPNFSHGERSTGEIAQLERQIFSELKQKTI